MTQTQQQNQEKETQDAIKPNPPAQEIVLRLPSMVPHLALEFIDGVLVTLSVDRATQFKIIGAICSIRTCIKSRTEESDEN